MNFETNFQLYIDVLSKYKKDLRSKVQLEIEQIKEIRKTMHSNKEEVTYSFSKIRLNIPKRVRPSHCIPRSLTDFYITLSTNEDIVFKKINKIVEDPFIKLGTINIVLDSKPYLSSWHLDRHIDSGVPSSFHPFYHLSFGGLQMEKLDLDGEEKFGHSLIVRAPRISHPPMELILSIDYILQHYFDKNELDLLSDPNYKKIINDLKIKFWKPYYLSLLLPFCDNSIVIDGNTVDYDSVFVNKINGLYN